jgi:hypothetical protein
MPQLSNVPFFQTCFNISPKSFFSLTISAALTDAVIELLSNPMLFLKIETNLKAEIQAKNWMRVANMTAQIYRAVLL